MTLEEAIAHCKSVANEKCDSCGNCLFLVKDDGKPYYCAIKDLYHLCDETDSACEEWKHGNVFAY